MTSCIGRPFQEIINPLDSQQAIDRFAEIVRGDPAAREDSGTEVRVTGKDGQEYDVKVNASSVPVTRRAIS